VTTSAPAGSQQGRWEWLVDTEDPGDGDDTEDPDDGDRERHQRQGRAPRQGQMGVETPSSSWQKQRNEQEETPQYVRAICVCVCLLLLERWA
jgi:hypothetical protein